MQSMDREIERGVRLMLGFMDAGACNHVVLIIYLQTQIHIYTHIYKPYIRYAYHQISPDTP